MLGAIRAHAPAVDDPALRDLLQHILLANRFWLLSVLGLPFSRDEEARPAASFDALVARYRSSQEQESDWIATATDAELTRTLNDPRIPGGACPVAHAILQVCLHSQGHRAQCAKMLRTLGGVPPATDFILWRVDRPAPSWPA